MMRSVRQMALNWCIHHTCMCHKIISVLELIGCFVLRSQKLLSKAINDHYWLSVLVLIVSMPVFSKFGGLRFEQVLFLMVLPFTLGKSSGFPIRMTAAGGALLLLLFFLTHIYSLFYLGFGLVLLLGLSFTKSKPGYIAYALVFITTPAFRYFFQVYSFSIRLQLTQLAGKVLVIFYPDVEVAGNGIILDKVVFSVAPECLGLNMFSAALVIALFSLAFWSRKYGLKPGIKLISASLMITFFLVLIANTNRILLTVLFKAMPDTFLHELIGLLVFILNIAFPLLLAGYWFRRFYQKDKPSKQVKGIPRLLLYLQMLMLGLSVFTSRNQLHTNASALELNMPGMSCSIGPDQVRKLSNDQVLIYIKPPAFFLGSDHHPFICWKGSGYQVLNENTCVIDGQELMTFELYKEGEKPLYSCWWYSNGQQNTCRQIEWRLAQLKGEKAYSVVNVSAANQEECLQMVRKVIATKHQ
ncbi:MAG: exosortase N [Carboxylicivirga sp.]|nr:exosortase N [Carboxylicivirga sp.]